MLILNGDCREKIKSLPDSSIDVVCSDPPYELNFMNKAWDSSGVAFDPVLYTQLYRVLKPGGVVMAFSATRTFHRLCEAVEGAGFIGLELHAWCYGSGFPKSLNISKAIEKHLGHKPKFIKTYSGDSPMGKGPPREVETYSSPEARRWQGYGTALKPAWEPVVIAKKEK